MKTKYYVFALIIGLTVTFWLQMPASWLAFAVTKMSQHRVQILDPKGTVWDGSGILMLTGGQGSDTAKVLPDRINWRLNFNWFSAKTKKFTPNVAVGIEQSCCLAKPLNLVLEPGISNHQLYINSFNWRVPASVLAGLGSPWNTLNLQGSIELDSKDWQLIFNNKKFQAIGSVDLLLKDMSSTISTIRPLGSYKIAITPKDAGRNLPEIEFDMSTIKGAFQMSGQGLLRTGAVTFKGQAYAKPEYANGLATLLTMIQSSRGPIQFRILRGEEIPLGNNSNPKNQSTTFKAEQVGANLGQAVQSIK